MQVLSLYRYIREDGGMTTSLVEPDVEYTLTYRLIADDGMRLVKGDVKTQCVDVAALDGWGEEPLPEEESSTDPKTILESAMARFKSRVGSTE